MNSAEESLTGRKLMKKNLLHCMLLVTVVAVLFFSCASKNSKITASGTIEAKEVRVSSKASGEIIELPVEEGELVKQGETLASIDHTLIDLQLGQAKAGVDLAEAQLQLLVKGARTEDIIQAQEQLNQASENLKRAEEDYKRIKELYQSGSAAQKQYEDADTRYALAKAQHNMAGQTLAKLKNFARPEEIKAAVARLDQAKYGVKILEKLIADCTIVSPVSGVITEKLAEKGELAGQNTTLFIISDLSTVYLTIYVPEPDLGRIKIDDSASISVDTYPGKSFKGKIVYISQTAEFTPKNIQTKDERVKLVYGIKIEIDNADGVFKPGMPADAAIPEPSLAE
jgi:HlyD family secretion protein